jgi:hypothetical protein
MIFVSARTNKRHHHHHHRLKPNQILFMAKMHKSNEAAAAATEAGRRGSGQGTSGSTTHAKASGARHTRVPRQVSRHKQHVPRMVSIHAELGCRNPQFDSSAINQTKWCEG